MVRDGIGQVPEVAAALESGGRVLELGCGVAARLCATLLAFPRATAVGVELSEDLAAWGRARADRLGVGDRLTYVVGDATTYQPEGEFDQVGWSQFFFPRATRTAALATAMRALRPGGWITMPAVWDGTPPPPGSELHKELAAERLALELWDVPLRSTHELREELAAAGFVDVWVEDAGMVNIVRGRKP